MKKSIVIGIAVLAVLALSLVSCGEDEDCEGQGSTDIVLAAANGKTNPKRGSAPRKSAPRSGAKKHKPGHPSGVKIDDDLFEDCDDD